MGKKFNELAELRDRSRQLMDENRRLRLAFKVSEGRAQQLAWKNAELRNQAEKERRTSELLSDIARRSWMLCERTTKRRRRNVRNRMSSQKGRAVANVREGMETARQIAGNKAVRTE